MAPARKPAPRSGAKPVLQATYVTTGIWEGDVSLFVQKSKNMIIVSMCDEHGSYIGGHDANHKHSLPEVPSTAAFNQPDVILVS